MSDNNKQTIESILNIQRNRFIDFLSEWKMQNENEYQKICEGLESADKGDYSTYVKLFEMCQSCIPSHFFTFCLNQFGIGSDESEIPENEKKIVEEAVDELFDFDGYAKFSFVNGEFDGDLVKEKDESSESNVYYMRIRGIDEWWQSVPLQYRMIASLMFAGVGEKNLKIRARRILIAAYVYLPDLIDNMCELAYEKKDPILLSGLYYTVLEHGLRNIAKQLGGVSTSTGGMGLFMPSLITSTVGKMVHTSVSEGFDKKSDWKLDFKKSKNLDIRREVMQSLEETNGKHGRPHVQQETFDFDDYLIGDKSAIKKEIMNILADIGYDYDIAFLKEALYRSKHMKEISFPRFYRAICELAGKKYEYDRAQRMDSLINYNRREFESSKKSRILRGRNQLKIMTDRLSAIH